MPHHIFSEDVLARFQDKVDKSGDCWLWAAGLYNTGYGSFGIKGRCYGAHRIAWQIECGDIPPGLCVLHKCDNRSCVRVDHLYLGTKQQNAIDTHSRGRWRWVAPGHAAPRPPKRKPGHPCRPVAERFWEKVDTRGGDIDQCWPWMAQVWRQGYGRFWKPGQDSRAKAHRIAYELHYGEAPGNLHVLHSCDNRACCNPHHLRLGTNADNTRDRTERGRGAPQWGEHNGRAKLSEADIREILVLLETGVSQQKVADRFGVKQPQVSRIARGEQWAHLR